MAAGEVTASYRGRKSTTPTTSSSRPSSARPTLPKRAHTSAASTTTLRNAAKIAATSNSNVNVAAVRAHSPYLSPGSRTPSRTPHTTGTNNPSPNYFGLKIEDDTSNPPDSDPGKHAKRNWGAYSGGGEEDDRGMPFDENPQYEQFRRQSERPPNHFNLTHSGLNRFSTDGRVATLKTLKEAQQGEGRGFDSTSTTITTTLRPPLSAGGRFQTFSATRDEDAMDVDGPIPADKATKDGTSYFGLSQHESPQEGIPGRPEIHRNPLSTVDSKHPQNSLPHTRVTTPVSVASNHKVRAETLPSQLDGDAPQLLSASELQNVLKTNDADSVLLLDLRVAPQYAQSRVKGALNLCIPTTLLKRPAYNIQRLADTFNSPDQKEKLNNWRNTSYIIVYDASSIQLKDAQSGINTLKKFRGEGYEGICAIIKGGFNAVSNTHPELVARSKGGGPPGTKGSLKLNLSKGSGNTSPEGMQVAGGCPMPDAHGQPANPFFGNIRQNMDLLDGVGQMPIKLPAHLGGANLRGLPSWLRDVVDQEEEGKLASERFLAIERAEQSRMQRAYTTQIQYGDPASEEKINGEAKQGKVQIAGIEKGTKNRYKDMLPYEHARVRLRHMDSDGCDYINASHIKTQWCHRRYIATQAPVPATFKDFWRLVWEQDVRVLVVLTAESENGQRKCHPYWNPDTYGHFKVKTISEKRVSLERPSRASLLDPNRKVSMPLTQMLASKENPNRMHRRATLMGEGDVNAGAQAGSNGPDAAPKEPAFCVVRKLALSDVHQPFVPLKEIAQVEYTSWPDFGAPAEPGELLSLVEQVDSVVQSLNNAGKGRKSDGADGTATGPSLPNGLMKPEDDESKWPAPPSERPIVVHCSAGCGRTGTFVTVDSVVDMLKRQRLVASRRRNLSNVRSPINVKVPHGAGSGGFNEPNPFETSTSALRLSSPTDSIVSPTKRMEINGVHASAGRLNGSADSIGITGSGSSNNNTNSNSSNGGSSSSGSSSSSGDEDDDEDGDDSDAMDEDEPNLDEQDWVGRDDIDLVAKTVEELRLQRLSMVQNLRQFTLCYESVVEWLVREMPERFRRDQHRKSYQG